MECCQELADVIDDEEESVLHTFSFTNIRVWEAWAGRISSGTLGTSGMSKETSDQTKGESFTFQPVKSVAAKKREKFNPESVISHFYHCK